MAASPLSREFIWNVDMEVNLFHAMRGHKPAGVNRHFQMIAIHEKLSSASKKITSDDVWAHLLTLYDLRALNESEIVPFPNKQTDFSLTGLSDLEVQPFPRTTYINSTTNEQQKQEVTSKNTPKSSSKTESKPSSHTPAGQSQKSELSKTDTKSSSSSSSATGKSNSQKGSGSSGSSSGANHSSKTQSSSQQSPALFTPDPSPKRTKRTRNVPTPGASPATPTEPAAKRRR